jgi:hypothetical protein
MAWLVALVAVLSTSGVIVAESSASKVKVNVAAEKPAVDGTQVITITLDIEKDWHLLANPVGNEILEAAGTKVRFEGEVKLGDVKIDYPKGRLIEDRDVGNYQVYEGQVQIKATVKRREGAGPLQLSVKFQAWGRYYGCLLPATVVKTID